MTKEELILKAEAAKDIEELMAIAEENGIELHEEDAKAYLRFNENEGINWAMIKAVWASPADTAIVPMADFLGLSSEGRINTPSTMGENWTWRIRKECLNGWLAEIIYHFTKVYRRIK